MKILGIDTTATACSVALYSDRLLAQESVLHGPTHSQTLLPFVKKVLEDGGCTLGELDLISISAGPGSFTGLRIGISAVKGLAFSDSIPCVGVSTLEALATNARILEGFTVCPVMDARRSEFYNALFRIENGVPIRLTEDRAISGENLAAECASFSKLIVLGDGAEKFSAMFPGFLAALAPEDIRYQNGESVCLVGLRDHERGKTVSCNDLSPAYLRLPQAEREWLNKNKSQKEN